MSVNSFLKQRAVNIVVDGQYALDHWYTAQGTPRTFSCHTSRVSPFRMMVAAPVLGKVGDHVSSYFSDFGSLDGRISDITARIPAGAEHFGHHAEAAGGQARVAGAQAAGRLDS